MKKLSKASAIAVATSLVLSLVGPFPAAAATAVSLGTADSFSVLAGSSIVDTNVSTIVSGDVGLSPGTAFGALTSAEVAGTIYAVDASGPDGALGNNPTLVNGAKTALTAAFTAAGQPTTGVISADLGSQTLLPGVYEDNDAPDSLGLTGTLTLNAQGDANAVFIFKTGSTLTTAASSSVVLINGAQACNVYWQIGSSATFGTNSTFKGNVLASVAITDNGGSIIEGRLLASTGAVTLNNTTVTKATCAVPPAVPAPSGGGGGWVAPIGNPPVISVTKVPMPLALPAGPGFVTYDYTVTNIGTVPIQQVQFSDNKCTNATFNSGDINGNAALDLTETWKYSCTIMLQETTTNTATVTGTANGFYTTDTANATVVVGLPLVPPLIHVVKTASQYILPAGGGPVTYMYAVTNPGTAPLNNVSIIDNKCTGLPGRVVGHPGDLNHNNLLENNEVWSFTCQTYLTMNTTNTGTAEGHANGLTAIDFALATVIVSAPVPKLPNTGLPPEGNGVTKNVVMLFGALAASLVLLYVARRKQTA
jgi:uncharacterized repeat protein (TIGR01451 family)